jgi:hypothetical protein
MPKKTEQKGGSTERKEDKRRESKGGAKKKGGARQPADDDPPAAGSGDSAPAVADAGADTDTGSNSGGGQSGTIELQRIDYEGLPECDAHPRLKPEVAKMAAVFNRINATFETATGGASHSTGHGVDGSMRGDPIARIVMEVFALCCLSLGLTGESCDVSNMASVLGNFGLLDMGCGAGRLMFMLALVGFKVCQGIELHDNYLTVDSILQGFMCVLWNDEKRKKRKDKNIYCHCPLEIVFDDLTQPRSFDGSFQTQDGPDFPWRVVISFCKGISFMVKVLEIRVLHDPSVAVLVLINNASEIKKYITILEGEFDFVKNIEVAMSGSSQKMQAAFFARKGKEKGGGAEEVVPLLLSLTTNLIMDAPAAGSIEARFEDGSPAKKSGGDGSLPDDWDVPVGGGGGGSFLDSWDAPVGSGGGGDSFLGGGSSFLGGGEVLDGGSFLGGGEVLDGGESSLLFAPAAGESVLEEGGFAPAVDDNEEAAVVVASAEPLIIFKQVLPGVCLLSHGLTLKQAKDLGSYGKYVVEHFHEKLDDPAGIPGGLANRGDGRWEADIGYLSKQRRESARGGGQHALLGKDAKGARAARNALECIDIMHGQMLKALLSIGVETPQDLNFYAYVLFSLPGTGKQDVHCDAAGKKYAKKYFTCIYLITKRSKATEFVHEGKIRSFKNEGDMVLFDGEVPHRAPEVGKEMRIAISLVASPGPDRNHDLSIPFRAGAADWEDFMEKVVSSSAPSFSSVPAAVPALPEVPAAPEVPVEVPAAPEAVPPR